MCLQCVSVVRLIVATQSISVKIIKEMLGSVVSGTLCIMQCYNVKCFILQSFKIHVKNNVKFCEYKMRHS